MSARWEYKVLKVKMGWKGFKYDEMEAELNELGQQGWEALAPLAPSSGQVGSLEVVVLLKRPLD